MTRINYDINYQGAINLMEAVMDRAYKDYMNELPVSGKLTRKQVEIETFIYFIFGDKASGVIHTLHRKHPLLK